MRGGGAGKYRQKQPDSEESKQPMQLLVKAERNPPRPYYSLSEDGPQAVSKKVDEQSPPTTPTHLRDHRGGRDDHHKAARGGFYSDDRVSTTAQWAMEIQRHERERRKQKKERRERRVKEGRAAGMGDGLLALRRSSTATTLGRGGR